jgi:hypothetical protein
MGNTGGGSEKIAVGVKRVDPREFFAWPVSAADVSVPQKKLTPKDCFDTKLRYFRQTQNEWFRQLQIYSASPFICIILRPSIRLSAAVRLLTLRVRIHPGARMSLVSVVCCQVEVSATSWSLVQRSPTECDVFECDREALIMRRS